MDHNNMLSGKRILLGVTGSIAAYKAVDILRRLREQGAQVRVVMTKNAARFVSRLTFETLSGSLVLCDEFADREGTGIGHIFVTEGLDLALIAPATANIIGKVAAGIADDTLTSTLLALDCPLVMAPAMNTRMYRNPVVQKNILFLKDLGTRFIEPQSGPLACGDVGPGRLADAESIIREISSLFLPKDFPGATVLITAGPTRESIDAVRYISNPSTGKMGYALAAAARDRGANVILITGPVQLASPPGVTLIPVVTAEEMRTAVMEHVLRAHVVIMAAAVSDFKPVVFSDRKVKKDSAPLTLQLERTRDILQELGRMAGRRVLVGFAAETDDILQNASRKLRDKNLDLIVVNDLLKKGSGFGADTNAVTMIDRSGTVTDIPTSAKSEIASRIFDNILELMANKGILP